VTVETMDNWLEELPVGLVGVDRMCIQQKVGREFLLTAGFERMTE